VELLRQVAARAGYSVRFITTSTAEQAILMLEQGQVQVLPGLGISPERSRRVAFTRPFETQGVHIFARRQGRALEDIASLKGLRVSLLTSSIAFERLSKEPDLVIHPAQSLSQGLFDLISGDTDAFVMQAPMLEQAASAAGLEGKLARSAQPLFEVSRAFAVHPEQRELLARLGKALDEYRSSPEFEELYNQWHAEPGPKPLPRSALWLMAALLVALGAGLLTWRYTSLWRMNRKLMAAVSERDQALSDLRLTQERMEALFTLTNMTGTDTDELIRFALEEAVRLTGSEIGFLLFVEGGRIDLSRVHWSMSVASSLSFGGGTSYPLAEAGLWADSLRTKKPIIINDFNATPQGKGLPDNHPPIRRFMAVPLLEDGQAAVFGMANKIGLYYDNDIRQVQLFLVGLWRVLKARRDAQSIRLARDYAESLIEGANAMLIGLDPQGRTTLFNAAAEKTTGYNRQEVLGRDWNATMLPEELRATFSAIYKNIMDGVEALPQQHENLLRTKDGRLRHVSWQNSLLKLGEQITGVIAFGIDITEQKKAEAELLRLHRAMEQAAEGMLIADESGVILFINRAFERMIGQEAPEKPLKGRSVFELNLPLLEHHSTSSPQTAPGALGREGVWQGTCVFAKPGGVLAEVEITVSVIRSGADHLTNYVAVCRDVTEKRLLEHQLWQAQKMEALGTLAGGVAHDFNNLLASIMGFTELALDDLPPDSRSRSCLDRVLAASLRARELVRQILSFSRRSEHRNRLLRVDLVLAEALKLLEGSLPKNVETRAEIDADVAILADPSQIHQVVMNLCTNAAQAMKDSGGVLCVRTSAGPLPVELAARHRLPPGDYLTLTVEDQGPGIAPGIMDRIFDPFFTTKEPGEGTGLGLAVVHGIVSSLGGRVRVESEPGQGARFFVILPIQPGGEEPVREPRNAATGGHERILMVDDEPDLLEFSHQTLGSLGYKVTTEKDSEAALRTFKAAPHDFDLVITDQSMPRLSGLQLAEGLRKARPDLPILLITGFSKAIPPECLETLGAVRLLSKPFSTGELARTVREVFARHAGGM